jgi:hypothetical protein
VNTTTLDMLTDIEQLRAFTAYLACDLDCSELAILKSIVAVLDREQRRRADDIHDVLRLGRVRQVAANEVDRLRAER